ncbi:MAG TPA: isoleucine--tRNA ligase [Patescibacteria group bacterium]|nr:isoleucine--tRNA ligase [Patescibacteria group bacterium]
MSFKLSNPKESFPKIEEEILNFWENEKIFKKSLDKNPKDRPYVFLDGPPFATGLPHYGHILSSVIKDVVGRYWTMKGFYVRRRWGWDCHGLPIENIVEKELQVSGKKDIEEKIGVDKFNETCRSKVLTYTKEWGKMVNRIGRWVDFENSYKTMDSTYMESVWWALKEIWNKDLIYEGSKVLMFCPRCETPVAKSEVAMDNSYKDVTEETLTAEFKVINPSAHSLPENTYVLAWTTTPWTLPSNVALAVRDDIDYVLVKGGEGEQPDNFILAKERLEAVFKGKHGEVLAEFKGSQLVGIEYEPLFDVEKFKLSGKKVYRVVAADFVTTVDGTGIVHIAPMYGEDDHALGVKNDLPMIPLVTDSGLFNENAPDIIKGEYFKKSEKTIKDDLAAHSLIFAREQYTHPYPQCWRCETPLFYNAISAWFINIQKIKDRLIELNEKVNWYPDNLKHGRFLNILETAPDWNISRNRYWATPLPFWKCDNKECTNVTCIGSVAELKEKAVNFDSIYSTDKVQEIDIHKNLVDKINIKCDKCGGNMTRIPEVIDCWVESGSMPFAEFHYPFENQDEVKSRMPGQFIAEYIAQTRAWFNYTHTVSGILFDNIAFENCVTTGTILNEKGEKMSKSKMNYTDPWINIDQFGVDALRYYLMTCVVMQADDLYFSDRDLKDCYNKIINTLWNVVLFYKEYSSSFETKEYKKSDNILDVWIVAKTAKLVDETTHWMDHYDTIKAGRPIKKFIEELSTWWLRRSRDRFRSESELDKKAVISTLRWVLLTLSKVMAPFTPFLAEATYSVINGEKESVHLENWPEIDEGMINEEIEKNMDTAKAIVEMGHSIRKLQGIRVRQPLSELKIEKAGLDDELQKIIADELNVKSVSASSIQESPEWSVKEENSIKIALNIKITPELKAEGEMREVIRLIQDARKEAKYAFTDQIICYYQTDSEDLKSVIKQYNEEIKKQTVLSQLNTGIATVKDIEKEGKIGESNLKISLSR